jgi:hypothetical protein
MNWILTNGTITSISQFDLGSRASELKFGCPKSMRQRMIAMYAAVPHGPEQH